MTRSLLADAFAHHVWSTLRLLDTCGGLTPAQLQAAAPGTYGSIIETLRHLVAADAGYLSALTGGSAPLVEQELSIRELREVMEGHRATWAALLTQRLDPDEEVVRHRNDGSETRAPLGIRLAQALHHGTDHRSQVCTVLTMTGVAAPAIDVWDFAEAEGRLVEVPPPA